MAVRHLYVARHAEPDDDGRLNERGVQQASLAALTVLRLFPDRAPAVVVFNDMSHLPDELRRTGSRPT